MKAERNDSSVLFQIDHLRAPSGQASARAGARSKPLNPSASAAPSKPFADESSGILEMQKLAQAYASDRKQPDPSDAIPSYMASNMTPAGMLAPVLLPMPARSKQQKLLIALTGFSGVVAAFVLIVAIVIAHRQDKEKAQAAMAALDAQNADSEVTAEQPQPGPKADPGTAAVLVPAAGTDDAALAANKAKESEASSAETRPSNEAQPERPEEGAAAGERAEETAEARERSEAGDERKERRERRAEQGERAERSGREEQRAAERSGREERQVAERRSSADLLEVGGGKKTRGDEGGTCMDEVACLLADGDAPACCARYQTKRRSDDGEERKVNARLPEEVSRGDISAAMNGVRSGVARCSQRHAGGGTVTLSVRVTGSGQVASVDVKSSPGEVVGACVAEAVKSAKFPESKKGVKFTYPFVLR